MVAANKGAQPGWLVPLSAGLCHLGKQGSFMPRDSISRIQFHRTGGTSATFDVTIKLVAAGSAAGGGSGGSSRALELGQIDAAELPKLQAYCMNQRVQVRWSVGRLIGWLAGSDTCRLHRHARKQLWLDVLNKQPQRHQLGRVCVLLPLWVELSHAVLFLLCCCCWTDGRG